MNAILPYTFYERPTLELAKDLLGKLLLVKQEEVWCGGYIVETEAYIGPGDRAAHSFGNRRTARTEVMFGPAGYAYVYQMHRQHLLNVVSGSMDAPEAILIRAIEPVYGIEWMKQRRSKIKKTVELSNGPGKLCQALGVTKEHYGQSFVGPNLLICEGISGFAVATGPRIGIENTGEAKEYPWRFWIQNHDFVSKS